MKKKVIGSAVIVAAIVIGLVALIPSFPAQTQKTVQNENLGLVVNTPSNTVTLNQLKQVYSETADVGVGRSNLYVFWNNIEPQQNQYNWKDTDILMSYNKQNNLKVTLYLSIINGRLTGPYPDWMGKPSFGTALEQDTVRVLDAIITRYGIVDTVIIGGDLDSYFDDTNGSESLYRDFFQNVYTELKQKHPDVRIGNAFALHNVINKNLEHYVTDFNDLGDFVAFTYLPVDRLNEIARTPAEAKADLQKALDMVPDKKIAFFEVSWSTSDLVNGTQADQAQFIKNAYEFYGENKSKIEFFTWYRLYDRQEGTCTIEQNFPDSKISIAGDQYVRERLASYTCDAGLIKADNSYKQGWDELKRQIQMINSAG